MNTKGIEEIVEEMFDTVYHTGEQPNLNKEWLRTTLTTLTQHHEAEVEKAVEDIIKMSDALELECGKDGDKGTKQWMAFKGFRNAVRDKYLTPTKIDKQ